MKKAFVLITTGLLSVKGAFAQDPQVQKVPENLVEKTFTLEVQFAAERTEYMNASVSSTVIRGFSEKKSCWEHASQVTQAIQEAAKKSGHKGRISFSCNPDTDFKVKDFLKDDARQ